MHSSTPEFCDTFHFRMDAKGRISVPAEWRVSDGLPIRMQVARCYNVPTLRVITQEELAGMQATIEDKDWSPERKRLKLGKLMSRTKVGAISAAGKLQIPKAAVETLGFEPGGEITLLGRGRYFEIYTPQNYAQVYRLEDEDDEDDDDTGF